jgi:signal transduction histidine kinase
LLRWFDRVDQEEPPVDKPIFDSIVSHGASRDGLLGRYSARLIKLAERERADVAVLQAHRQTAVADLARLDLQAQAADPERSDFVAHMFVAHMSHELRTPLNAIIGFSDLIRLRLKDRSAGEKIAGYVDDINGAGWHLLRVINDILDLSKIDAGKLDLTEEEVELAEVVESCARMIKGQADENRIEIACDVPASLPKLFADELKLKQVLINLLSNAVKFTLERGKVVLRARIEPTGAVITVADTGIGIEPHDLPKVFKPFTQLNANVSRKFKGTGLGLPLAKALVELHGGSLAIESAVGKGTTLTIRLPASRIVRGAGRPEAESQRAAAAPVASPALDRRAEQAQ